MRVEARQVLNRVVILIAVTVAASGCPRSHPPAKLPRQSPAAAGTKRRELQPHPGSSATLGERVAEHRARLREFVPGDDPVENLYFAWMLEPYRRATLAVAWKTLRVLEREVTLRDRGGGGLTDGETQAMLAWLARTWDSDWSPRAPGFKPHRLASVLDGGTIQGSRRLFAFADRSSFTQADAWFGDFDLLACTGFRLYPMGRDRPLTPEQAASFRAHAQALRIALLDVPLAASYRAEANSLAGVEVRIVPRTLKALLDSPLGDDAVAVVDPPRGERWSGMLARRGLARGLRRGALYAVGCVPPRGDRRMLPARTRAAMWVQALEGQRLGVFEGWRDVRDGTRTPYASRFAEPAYLETVAHTALDILRYGDWLAHFEGSCSVAVVVGDAQLAADGNLWSDAFLDLADALLEREVRFDVLNRAAAHRANLPYTLVVELPATKDLTGAATLWSPRSGIRRKWASPPAGAAAAALAEVIVERAGRPAPARAGSLLVADDGSEAAVSGVYARIATDRRAVAVVNLTGVSRHLRIGGVLDSWQGIRDVLSGAALDASFTLAPYQVRILVPPSALP